MTVSLRPISRDNWIQCIELKPTKEQVKAGFVAPNAVSLTQAAYEPWWNPLGIYADEEMVGFIMYGSWPEAAELPSHYPPEMPTGEDHVLRFMIDERYQGKGYGRAALAQVIEQVRQRPGTYAISLSYEPENARAAAVYASLGFKPTGHMHGGELEVRLAL